jgi:glutamate dehydrogenase
LEPTVVAKLYYAVGSRFKLGRLRAAGEVLASEGHWQRLAVAALGEELYVHQYRLTENVLQMSKTPTDPASAIDRWSESFQGPLDRAEQLLAELWAGDISDVSMIAVASRALKSLADQRG